MNEGLKFWRASEAMKAVEPRAVTTHGVAYAGVWAMMALLQCPMPDVLTAPGGETKAAALKDYKEHLVRHCTEAVREVREKVNVNQFWTDVLAARESYVFGRTMKERRRVFKVMEDKYSPLRVPQYQLDDAREQPSKSWKSYLLFIRPKVVLNMLREYKRRMGVNVMIDQADLLAQLKTRPYWVEPPPGRGTHTQRFAGINANMSCWCFRVDLHELGFLHVTQEEWEASKHPDGEPLVWVPNDKWTDPRKGDLFALIDSLLRELEEPDVEDGGRSGGGT